MSPAAGCSYRLAGSSGSSDDSLDRPRRRSTRETVAVDTPVSSAMRAPVMRSRRNCSMRLTTLGGVAARRCIGREERSCSPAGPSASKRCTHLRAVRSLTLNAAAAAFKVRRPSLTACARANRPLGVSFALLCSFT